MYIIKTASISHVNSQSLVLADYGVKTGHCQLYAVFFNRNVSSFTEHAFQIYTLTWLAKIYCDVENNRVCLFIGNPPSMWTRL